MTRVLRAARREMNWASAAWFTAVHVLGACGVWYMATAHASWATLALAASLFALVQLSLTVGMHRLYAHRAYTVPRWFEVPLVLAAAAALQNSVIWWAGLHRRHHRHSDGPLDPYSVVHGFWWAHMGWILRGGLGPTDAETRDLRANPVLRFQHRWYYGIGLMLGIGGPAALAALWGDALGGALVGGFLRLVFQYHTTFSINSFAHVFGRRGYESVGTARSNTVLALLTMGEGYHHRHHLAPEDWRLGAHALAWDPGKWFIWLLAKAGVARGLRTVPERVVWSRVASELARPRRAPS